MHRTIFTLLVIIAISTAGQAALAATAKSTFDTGTEGWTITDNGANTTPVFRDGVLYGKEAQSGIDWYYVAPSKFLGDKSAFYNGSISFRLRQKLTDKQIDVSDIRLIGDGLTLTVDAGKNPSSAWSTYQVSLSPVAGWQNKRTGKPATVAEIKQVMGKLTAIHIRGEYRIGEDASELDDVMLVTGDGSCSVEYVEKNTLLEIAPGGSWKNPPPEAEQLKHNIPVDLHGLSKGKITIDIRLRSGEAKVSFGLYGITKNDKGESTATLDHEWDLMPGMTAQLEHSFDQHNKSTRYLFGSLGSFDSKKGSTNTADYILTVKGCLQNNISGLWKYKGYSGVWDLTQLGNKVTGSFDNQNEKGTITGTVDGSKAFFSFKNSWVRHQNLDIELYAGGIECALSTDSQQMNCEIVKSKTGDTGHKFVLRRHFPTTQSAKKISPLNNNSHASKKIDIRAGLPIIPPENTSANNPVKEKKITEKLDISGVWETDWTNLHLRQDGSKVIGLYPDNDHGEVIGAINSKNLSGIWIEDYSDKKCKIGKRGRFYWGRWVADFEGDMFKSKWGHCNDPLTYDFQGKRVSRFSQSQKQDLTNTFNQQLQTLRKANIEKLNSLNKKIKIAAVSGDKEKLTKLEEMHDQLHHASNKSHLFDQTEEEMILESRKQDVRFQLMESIDAKARDLASSVVITKWRKAIDPDTNKPKRDKFGKEIWIDDGDIEQTLHQTRRAATKWVSMGAAEEEALAKKTRSATRQKVEAEAQLDLINQYFKKPNLSDDERSVLLEKRASAELKRSSAQEQIDDHSDIIRFAYAADVALTVSGGQMARTLGKISATGVKVGASGIGLIAQKAAAKKVGKEAAKEIGKNVTKTIVKRTGAKKALLPQKVFDRANRAALAKSTTLKKSLKNTLDEGLLTASSGSAVSAGMQYKDKGKVDLEKVLKDGVMSGASSITQTKIRSGAKYVKDRSIKGFTPGSQQSLKVQPSNQQPQSQQARPVAKAKPLLQQPPQIKPVAKAKPLPQQTPQVRPVAKTKPLPQQTPQVKPVAKAKPRPQQTPQVKPVAKAKPLPQQTQQVKPVAKAKPRPQQTQQVKPVAKAKPRPQQTQQVRTVAKAKPRPQQTPQVKPVAKAKPRPQQPQPVNSVAQTPSRLAQSSQTPPKTSQSEQTQIKAPINKQLTWAERTAMARARKAERAAKNAESSHKTPDKPSQLQDAIKQASNAHDKAPKAKPSKPEIADSWPRQTVPDDYKPVLNKGGIPFRKTGEEVVWIGMLSTNGKISDGPLMLGGAKAYSHQDDLTRGTNDIAFTVGFKGDKVLFRGSQRYGNLGDEGNAGGTNSNGKPIHSKEQIIRMLERLIQEVK